MMEHNQRRRLWMLGPMVVVALLSGVLIGKGWERTGHASETYEELRTFSEVLTQVQKNYVDDTKVKDLVQGAIRGMLSTLDPHSAYMTPEMYKEMQVETKGEFGGVGIQIGVTDRQPSPRAGTAASSRGRQATRRTPAAWRERGLAVASRRQRADLLRPPEASHIQHLRAAQGHRD